MLPGGVSEEVGPQRCYACCWLRYPECSSMGLQDHCLMDGGLVHNHHTDEPLCMLCVCFSVCAHAYACACSCAHTCTFICTQELCVCFVILRQWPRMCICRVYTCTCKHPCPHPCVYACSVPSVGVCLCTCTLLLFTLEPGESTQLLGWRGQGESA